MIGYGTNNTTDSEQLYIPLPPPTGTYTYDVQVSFSVKYSIDGSELE